MADNRRLLKLGLDQARRDLVDLSRRNRLLHAPLFGKRPWCVAIIGSQPDEVFEKLYRQDTFRGYTFRASDVDGLEDGEQVSTAIVDQPRAQPGCRPTS